MENNLPSIEKKWRKFYKAEDLSEEYPKTSFYSELNKRTEKNVIAMDYLGKKITYEELENLINDCVYSLTQIGVKKGTVVSISLPNTPEEKILQLALNKIGAISSFIFIKDSIEEVLSKIKISNTEYYFASDTCYESLKKADFSKTKVKQIITVSAKDSMNLKYKLLYNISNLKMYKKINNVALAKHEIKKLAKFKFDKKNITEAESIELTSRNVNNIDNNVLTIYGLELSKLTKLSMIRYMANAFNQRQIKLKVKEQGLFMKWNTFFKKHQGKLIEENVPQENEIASYYYTGATTGEAKAVCITNENINSSCKQTHPHASELQKGDRVLYLLPNAHIYGGINNGIFGLYESAELVFIPNPIPSKMPEYIDKLKPNLVFLPSTVVNMILNNKNSKKIKDLSHIKYFIVGGSCLEPQVEKDFNQFLEERNCKCKIQVGYGLTETTGCSLFGHKDCNKTGVIGVPLPNTDVKIVNNETKEELSYNEDGEICISGPSVMAKYLNGNNDNLTPDENGKIWFHTGDVGHIDEDGVVTYVDRYKNIIIVNGNNVYPEYIETIIKKHPLVKDVVVKGESDSYSGEKVVAYINLVDIGLQNDRIKKELFEYFKNRLNKYSMPTEIIFVNLVNKTGYSKVNRAKPVTETGKKLKLKFLK